MKTASRILGSAFFAEGFEVQDAPRYGAERRGAPIFAYVRADADRIHERGIIRDPDLVVVGDASLVAVPAAGVLAGLSEQSVLLINSEEDPEVWRQRLALRGPVLTLAALVEERGELQLTGATCAGAAARLVGVIPRSSLEAAIREELSELPADAVALSLEKALAAYDAMQPHAGCVTPGAGTLEGLERPDWVELTLDPVAVSAPDVHGSATSIGVNTGVWRTSRPIIDLELCKRCSWICSTFCPDSAIHIGADRVPEIDYPHCKGCLICAVVCPLHAIRVVPEQDAPALEREEHSP
jgi:pyruvate ferredoxin oxidoreductase gamma subunit